MKQINEEVLKDASHRLLFDISDEEMKLLLNEFDVLIKQFELLKDIENVNEVALMTFPYEIFNDYLREDVPSDVLTKEEALKNAKNVKDGQIKLPKVV